MRKTISVSVKMPVAMANAAKRRAKRGNQTVSAVVREALRHYETCDQAAADVDDIKYIERLIAEAKAMSRQEMLAEDKRLRAYEDRQARKLGITEEDAVRIVHESRARRRAS